MPITQLSIGDSIIWGQGLAEKEKIHQGMCGDLAVLLGEWPQIVHYAHSGAVLASPPGEAREAAEAGWSGEIPRGLPSIGAQWQRCLADHGCPEIILMNGGINDVSVRTMTCFRDNRAPIGAAIRQYCGAAMTQLLLDSIFVADHKPLVLITGYYAAISSASSFSGLLDAVSQMTGFIAYYQSLHAPDGVSADIAPLLTAKSLLGVSHPLRQPARNWETFAREANACLRDTVQAVNAALGERRVWFVDPQLPPAHAMFTAAPYLFHPQLPPRDAAAAARITECPLRYDARTQAVELACCLLAATGHPNASGAHCYREQIATVLPELAAQLLRERRAALVGAAAGGIGGLHALPTAPPEPETTPAAARFVSPYEPAIPAERLLRLKGQVHCHWFDDFKEISLGWLVRGAKKTIKIRQPGLLSLPPRSVADTYHTLGYHFLAFTEHNTSDVYHYVQERHGIRPGTCHVHPTGEEEEAPTFIHLLRSEEVTPPVNHVLALGVHEELTPEVNSAQAKLGELAALVQEKGGVAFLPHPGQTYRGKPEQFHADIVVNGTQETPFSAMAVRTAATHILHREWLGLWDVLLNQEIVTRTAPDAAGRQREILLPAFAEDDYAPIGVCKDIRFLTPGSTWIELEIDRETLPWPGPLTADANAQRHDVLTQALRSGRWWTYWDTSAQAWPKATPYPRLTLTVDPLRQVIRVTSSLTLASLSVITSNGMTRPNAYQRNVSSLEYTCTGAERFVRIAAKYQIRRGDIVVRELRICSNPVWVREPEAPRAYTFALPPKDEELAPPAVEIPAWASDHFLQGAVTLPLRVEGAIIHAPVSLDDRVVGFAKPVNGSDWRVELQCGDVPSGDYTLTVEVVDKLGRSATAAVPVAVHSDVIPPTLTVDPASVPSARPTAPVLLRGQVRAGNRAAALLGVVALLNDYAYNGVIVGEDWCCEIPADAFTAGEQHLQLLLIDARATAGSLTLPLDFPA